MKHLLLTIITAFLMLSMQGVSAGEVNINTADATELAAELKGVGLNKAEAIVEYRQQHGNYETADELAQVKGIGLRTVDLNRDSIVVSKE